MGILSFIFGGGNIGLIAKSIAGHHKRLGDFNEVLKIYESDFRSRPVGSRKYDKAKYALGLIEKREIKNYRDLAVLALVVDAAPSNQYFHEVARDFSSKLTKYLTDHGVDNAHITGNVLK